MAPRWVPRGPLGPLLLWGRPASGCGLCAAFALVLWLLPVPYWSLLFLVSLVWDWWRKKR